MNDMSVPSLMDLRMRVVDGDPITPEEYAQVVDNLRSDRSAKPASKKSTSKADKEAKALAIFPAELNDLFDK